VVLILPLHVSGKVLNFALRAFEISFKWEEEGAEGVSIHLKIKKKFVLFFSNSKDHFKQLFPRTYDFIARLVFPSGGPVN